MFSPAIKDLLSAWATKKPLINRLWIFGSFARADHRDDSDLDIAIELDMASSNGVDESGGFATWAAASNTWEAELNTLLPHEIDLQLYIEDETPTIHAGLERSSCLIYQKFKLAKSNTSSQCL